VLDFDTVEGAVVTTGGYAPNDTNTALTAAIKSSLNHVTAPLTRPGFTFFGWYQVSNTSVGDGIVNPLPPYDGAGLTHNSDWFGFNVVEITGDVTLRAQWAVSYTIRLHNNEFNANPGITPSYRSIELVEGTPINIRYPNPFDPDYAWDAPQNDEAIPDAKPWPLGLEFAEPGLYPASSYIFLGWSGIETDRLYDPDDSGDNTWLLANLIDGDFEIGDVTPDSNGITHLFAVWASPLEVFFDPDAEDATPGPHRMNLAQAIWYINQFDPVAGDDHGVNDVPSGNTSFIFGLDDNVNVVGGLLSITITASDEYAKVDDGSGNMVEFDNKTILPFNPASTIELTIRGKDWPRNINMTKAADASSGFEVRRGILALCRNITLNGMLSNEKPLVTIEGGTFELRSDTTRVINNMVSGVRVNRGTFNMFDGVIFNNNSPDHGGGVYVDHQGVFNMFDGAIENNRTAETGAGVYVDGRFNMRGGVILGNTAGFTGGGVQVQAGTTRIENGVIAGSTTVAPLIPNVGNFPSAALGVQSPFGNRVVLGTFTLVGDDPGPNDTFVPAGTPGLANTDDTITVTAGQMAP
jgi:hypothetical protein